MPKRRKKIQDLKVIPKGYEFTIRGKSSRGKNHDYRFTVIMRPVVNEKMEKYPSCTFPLGRTDKVMVDTFFVKRNDIMRGAGVTIYYHNSNRLLVTDGVVIEDE